MNLFETNEFEERIRSVENKAGMIAWKVIIILLVPVLVLFGKFGEPSIERYFVLTVLLIALITHEIILHENGINSRELVDEILRVQKSKAAKRFGIQHMFTRCYYAFWVGVYFYNFDQPLTANIAPIIFTITFLLISYPSERNWVFKKLYLKNRKHTPQEEEES